MRKTGKITGERLREVVSYDPATGVFLWLRDEGGKWPHAAGDRAGTVKAHGYRRLFIDGVEYQASAMAWLWIHGEFPARNIRLKDGNRDNVASENLSFGATDSKDKASMNAYSRKWKSENPEKRRAAQRKAYYGLTQGQYEQMLLDQNGVCACCGKPETQFANGNPLPLCVDHCHSGTGVRGLLCRHCNSMLGHAKDNAATLRAAADYLERHADKRDDTNIIPLVGRKIVNDRGN